MSGTSFVAMAGAMLGLATFAAVSVRCARRESDSSVASSRPNASRRIGRKALGSNAHSWNVLDGGTVDDVLGHMAGPVVPEEPADAHSGGQHEPGDTF